MPQQAKRFVALAAAGAMLAGCANMNGPLAADPADSCGTYVTQLNSTGDYFTGDILRGAAVGAVTGGVVGGLASGNWRGALIGAGVGAAVGAAGGYLSALQQQNRDQAALNAQLAGDLGRENEGLDRTQIAFNQLMDCRFQQAEAIRRDARDNKLPRDVAQSRMADLRTRTQRDIEGARQISGRVGTRAAEFDTAVDAVSPGAVAAAKGRRVGRPVTTRAPTAVAVRLRPDAGAPTIAEVKPRDQVTLRPSSTPGFARVESNGQTIGYAETRSFGAAARGVASPIASPGAAGGSGDVRSLAASNIARRENFQDSVATASAAASGSGFELAG